jgi:hypothetical protein
MFVSALWGKISQYLFIKKMNFRTGGCEAVRENKAFSTSLSLSNPRAHWR